MHPEATLKLKFYNRRKHKQNTTYKRKEQKKAEEVKLRV